MDAQLTKIIEAVARVDERVRSLDVKVCDMRDTTIERLNDHTARVKSLELTRARQRGAAGVIVTLAAAVGSVVAYFKS